MNLPTVFELLTHRCRELYFILLLDICINKLLFMLSYDSPSLYVTYIKHHIPAENQFTRGCLKFNVVY